MPCLTANKYFWVVRSVETRCVQNLVSDGECAPPLRDIKSASMPFFSTSKPDRQILRPYSAPTLNCEYGCFFLTSTLFRIHSGGTTCVLGCRRINSTYLDDPTRRVMTTCGGSFGVTDATTLPPCSSQRASSSCRSDDPSDVNNARRLPKRLIVCPCVYAACCLHRGLCAMISQTDRLALPRLRGGSPATCPHSVT